MKTNNFLYILIITSALLSIDLDTATPAKRKDSKAQQTQPRKQARITSNSEDSDRKVALDDDDDSGLDHKHSQPIILNEAKETKSPTYGNGLQLALPRSSYRQKQAQQEDKKDFSDSKNQIAIEVKLHDDIFSYTFSFLDGNYLFTRLSHLNKHFHKLIQTTMHPRYFSSLNLSNYVTLRNFSEDKRKAHIQHLISGNLKAVGRIIPFSTCIGLRKLTLSGPDITDDILKGLAPHLRNLQYLDLSYCLRITSKGLEALAPYLDNLQYLNLSYCQQITDKGLEFLAPHLKNLQYLNLSQCCTNITNTGFTALAPYLGKLQHLNIDSCSRINDAGLEALAPYLDNLQHLNLACCLLITDKGLEFLAPHLNNLQHLNLTLCHLITDKGLEVLAPHLNNLQHLNLSDCFHITNKGLVAFFALYHGNLQYLDLPSSNHITDEGLEAIAHHFNNLRHLKLFFNFITYKGLAAIAPHLKNLEDLTISHGKITDLSPQALKTLAQHLPHLQKLKFSQSIITNEVSQYFVAYLLNLKSLNLDHCDIKIDIGAFTQKLSHLESLIIKDYQKITGQELSNALKNLPNLRNLEINCEGITDEGLKALTPYFHKLPRLNLSSCRKLSHQYRKSFNRQEIQKLKDVLLKSSSNSSSSSSSSSLLRPGGYGGQNGGQASSSNSSSKKQIRFLKKGINRAICCSCKKPIQPYADVIATTTCCNKIIHHNDQCLLAHQRNCK